MFDYLTQQKGRSVVTSKKTNTIMRPARKVSSLNKTSVGKSQTKGLHDGSCHVYVRVRNG